MITLTLISINEYDYIPACTMKCYDRGSCIEGSCKCMRGNFFADCSGKLDDITKYNLLLSDYLITLLGMKDVIDLENKAVF